MTRLHANNGCECDWCAPTPEGKAQAAIVGRRISEQIALFDGWKALDPQIRPAFHIWADRERSARKARGLRP